MLSDVALDTLGTAHIYLIWEKRKEKKH